VPDGMVEHVLERLGLSPAEFEAIMQAPTKCFHDYPTYYPVLRALRPLVKAATWVGLVHPVLYKKFFG